MKNALLQYMKESPLFDEKAIESRYRRLSYKRLEQALAEYRDFCLGIAKLERSTDSKELSTLVEGFNLFKPDQSFLAQCALYLDGVTLNDPLFELTLPKSEQDQVMSNYLGLSNDQKPDRSRVAQSAKYIRSMKRAIKAGFVKFLPISYLHEPPKNIPIRASENLFFEVLPPEVMEYFHNHAKVNSLKKSENGWAITGEEISEMGRAIAITFGDDIARHAIYFLLHTEVLSVDEETRQVKFVQHLPETPPEPELFQNWVTQSINQAAGRLFDQVANETYLAHQIGATYLTRSTFVAELLRQQLKPTQDLTTDIMNLTFNLDLPVLKNTSLNNVIEIREKDGEAFENFRTELEKKLRGLRQLSDTDKLKVEMDNVSHELAEVQIHEIDRKIANIKRKMIPDAFILVFGLTAVIQANGIGIPALLYVIDKGFKTYNEYITSVKENPAFFLWKIKEQTERGTRN